MTTIVVMMTINDNADNRGNGDDDDDIFAKSANALPRACCTLDNTRAAQCLTQVPQLGRGPRS